MSNYLNNNRNVFEGMSTLQTYKSYFEGHTKFTDDGCQRWTGGKNNLGYGLFRFDGKMRTVHRLRMYWEGYDINDKVVYHICDNYDCVNVEHLRVGTRYDKAQIMAGKGRAGTTCKDMSKFVKCKYCGTIASPPVIGKTHNDKCVHKPLTSTL